jgi:hypothetical protein
MSISLPTAYKVQLNLNFGALRPIVEWCDRNCSDDWRYMEDPNGDMYNSWIFFFNNEKDYVNFILWKK